MKAKTCEILTLTISLSGCLNNRSAVPGSECSRDSFAAFIQHNLEETYG